VSAERHLLPSATEVPFADIESTLARMGQPSRGQAGPRALTGTVVVIGPLDRLFEAADALEKISARAGIRTVLISHGDNPAPSVRLSGHAIAIDGLQPDFVNNAVAALRLSSLPTLVWWRGGGIDALDGLSTLADRLVLDAPDPVESWRRVPELVERTAVSDLRWTRLTRWRALMAHFFDVPEVVAAARAFDHLDVAGADRHAMRLFAGWIVSSLQWPAGAAIAFREAPGASPIVRARLSNHAGELLLALASSGTCVETAAHVEGHAGATRIVTLGDQSLGALMAEELRIRSRDLAFERALAAAERLP
jgi:glucose-6-phosphate dehydrogenase assembly protein OpcA